MVTWHGYILKNFFTIRCPTEGKRNVTERDWRRLVEYRRDLLLVRRLTLSCMWLLNRSRKRRLGKSFRKKRTAFLLLEANEYLRPKTILGICGFLRGILLQRSKRKNRYTDIPILNVINREMYLNWCIQLNG